MSPLSKILIGIVISVVYVGLNWLLVTTGSSFAIASSFSYGPSALLAGFATTVVVAVVLFVFYLLAIRKLIRAKKEHHQQSQVVHIQLYPGQIYRHYKGHYYKVIALGIHSETGEELVAYRREEDGHVFFRPLSMWFEEVEYEGKKVTRFTYIHG